MIQSLETSQPTVPLGGKRIRVLIVDDSVVLRSLLTRMLGEEPNLEVIGAARNGVDALVKVQRLLPDVITLDIEMPELDGIATLRLMQERHPNVKVVMCSSLTERGAKVTVDALIAGASDYVTKVPGPGNCFEALGHSLRAKILHICSKSPARLPSPAAAKPAIVSAPMLRPRRSPAILAIGVSTGGPSALAKIVPQLPPDFPLPVVIVQHMPPFFTKLLAERLATLSRIPVHEAEHGMPLRPGHAVIAPGDYHMQLVKRQGNIEIQLNQQERENSCRPAVDVLFRSVAQIYGGATIAMILTGMGQDGLIGTRVLKAQGARVLAQDSESSVVWGMPGAVVEAHLANSVLPLDDMIPEVLRLL